MLADPVSDEPPLLRLVGRLLDWVVVLCGAGLMVLVFGNVISRFVLALDIAWSSELATFLLVWGTFLGGAAAARRRAHMRVGEIVGLLGGRTRTAAEIAICLVVAGTLVPVVWFGVAVAAIQWPQLTTVLYLPVGLLYLAMPVGAALSLLFVLHDAVRIARGRAHPAEPAGV
jgi:TRAP-type C4-dicarboxylate transport system permease small subunit